MYSFEENIPKIFLTATKSVEASHVVKLFQNSIIRSLEFKSGVLHADLDLSILFSRDLYQRVEEFR
jgi:hypothetical protein